MTQPNIDGTGHGIPRMLYASDGSNWYAILVDSDGHVKVDVVASALPSDAATQTTLASVLTALQLIDDFALGTNKLFGYYDRYLEVASGTSTGGASTYAYGTVVPAGELWIITAISVWHDDPTAREMISGLTNLTVFTEAPYSLSLAQWVRLSSVCNLVLKAGDKAYGKCNSLLSGKHIYLTVAGYKMKVA